MKRLKQLKKWVYKQLSKITPGKNAIKGASIALLLVASVLFTVSIFFSVKEANDPWIIMLFVILVVAIVLGAYLTLWVLKKLGNIPRILKLSLFIAIPVLLIVVAFELIYLAALIVLTSLAGAAIAIFRKAQFKLLSTPKKVVTLIGSFVAISLLIGIITAYIPTGFEISPVINAASLNRDYIEPIESPSPATYGDYTVKTLTYGSGKDKHRTEFGENVTIQTDSVNGVSFLDNWDGLSGWYREQFWGFNASALPVNGYVWYPEGEGPFPLVLVVHGNHLMSDFSDKGYEYLGKLLASRGIIVASIDENFLNGSWSDIPEGLDEENDARGWMLLEHLRVWHHWNKNKKNIFFDKVDISNIALIGHSRGGEAVGHAAFLNKLPYYSDDASIALNYNYNIKSIVAIAPVDKQYEPGNTPNQIKDVSYFTLHGSQDGDVSSFAGSKQFERVTFSDSTSHFKSGLYIKGANHGQFNTSWGDNDVGIAATKLLNNKQLLSAQDQREIAKVYISAFLETTLKSNRTYLPLFTDARKGKNWLPETIYLTQYEDSTFDPIVTYDEDFNVLTTGDTIASISSKNLTVWKEQEIDLKWGEKGSRAAYIGWHYKDITDGETIPDSIKASYTFDYSTAFAKADSTSAFTFSLAESTENTDPKSSGKWVKKDKSEENEAQDEGEDEDEDDTKKSSDQEEAPQEPIDFSIIIQDDECVEVHFCLSDFSALQREIGVRIWKAQFITEETLSEKVFQTFLFPLNELKERHPNFDVKRIQQIQFVFDKTIEGVMVLDNVGFMKSI